MLKKKVLTLFLVILILMGITGCNIIQIDPEKDMKRTVVEVEGEEIPKKAFINLMTYNEMLYQLNDHAMPEGEELDSMKEDLLESLVEIELLKREAEKDQIEIDEEAFTAEVDSTIEMMKSGFESEEKYISFIEDKHLNQEEYEQFINEYIRGVHYANDYLEKVQEELLNSGEEAGKTIVTVGGKELPKDEFYYYLSQMELEYYLRFGQGLPADANSLASIYSQIQDQIAQSYLIRNDAEEKKITLADKEVNKKTEEIQDNYTSLLGGDISDYLKKYYISDERFDEILILDARTQLYEESLIDSFKEDITVSEKEISEYYEENKNSYDTSTVSAKHILTKSKELANDIRKETTDAKSFESALKKYGDHEEVTEATDLKEFTKGQMDSKFEEAAFSMDKGEVSDPIESEFGYHIIYVYDKNTVKIPSLKEKTAEIEKTLINEKATTKLTEYKSDLVSEAKIKKEIVEEPFEYIIEDLKDAYDVKINKDVL